MNVNTRVTIRHWRIPGKGAQSVAERSGSAAGRAAGRSLQPAVSRQIIHRCARLSLMTVLLPMTVLGTITSC